MTNNTEVTVTQADIRAAADFMDECNPYLGDCGMKNSVHLAVRQAFAQHRTRSVGEPVAWQLHHRTDRESGYIVSSQLTEDDKANGWTETPLYPLVPASPKTPEQL